MNRDVDFNGGMSEGSTGMLTSLGARPRDERGC